MTFAVRYYTKTGNTKRLAEAIAKELGVEALPISVPVTEKVDYLFLGNSYYAFSIDPEVRAFVSRLDSNLVGRVVNFGTAAMLNSTYKKVKAEADKIVRTLRKEIDLLESKFKKGEGSKFQL